MKQTISKSKSKKGRKRRKSKISEHQERKKEDSAQGEYAYSRLPRSAGGGKSPRRNDRITESATKETREAKRKEKKAILETNGTRQGERTKRKGTRKGNTENDKKILVRNACAFCLHVARFTSLAL